MEIGTLLQTYGRVNSLRRAKFAAVFEGLPLTCVQALALHFVVHQSALGEVYPKDIEKFLTIRGSSVNSLLNFLERDGYVVREATKVDGRYKRIVPTSKATELEDEIARRIDLFVDGMFGKIPPDELENFQQILDMLEQNLLQME